MLNSLPVVKLRKVLNSLPVVNFFRAQFVGRFNQEMISLPPQDFRVDMEVFLLGLDPDSPLYKELTMNTCFDFEGVQAKAMSFICLEEDSIARMAFHNKDRVEKCVADQRRGQLHHPYTRPHQTAPTATTMGKKRLDWKETPTLPPKLSSHNFYISPAEFVEAMEQMGPGVA